MTTKTRIINRIIDLEPGDEATFRFDGMEYTGPMHESGGGLLLWANMLIRDIDGRAGFNARYFVKAIREVPALPTEPLSVITDVVTDTGREYSHAVLIEEKIYGWLAADGPYYQSFQAEDIVSFRPARVVPVDA